MAFDYTNFYPSSAPSGYAAKEWTYTTTDTVAATLASGYFNKMVAAVAAGDIINVSSVNSLGFASRTSNDRAELVVASNDGTTVLTRSKGSQDNRNIVSQFDDFDGATLSTKWSKATKGSDGATVDFVVSADTSGKLQGTTGAGAGGTMAANGIQFHSALNWKANQGGLAFEARVKISAITNISVFVGLTDQVAALEAPIISAGSLDTITTNADDAVGFMFDTSMSAVTDTIWLVGTAATVDATLQDTGLFFVADTYKTLRIELTTAGVATFFVNGSAVGTAMTGAVTPTVALTPVVTVFTRTAASATMAIDYISVQALRA